VSKFRFYHACFQKEEVSANFGAKESGIKKVCHGKYLSKSHVLSLWNERASKTKGVSENESGDQSEDDELLYDRR